MLRIWHDTSIIIWTSDEEISGLTSYTHFRGSREQFVHIYTSDHADVANDII